MLLTSVIVSTLFSVLILSRVMIYISDNCKMVINYRGYRVYSCGGIFLFANIVLICTSLLIFDRVMGEGAIDLNILIVLIGVLSATFTGYLDDNSKDMCKGIYGHGCMLLRGKFTSGNIKALTGIFFSFIICLIVGYRGYSLLVNTLLISLTQNFINLLDLRPGRSIKAYTIFFSICIPFIDLGSVFFHVNVGILISLIFYISYEMKELYMMGDTGSNVLGIVLGMTWSFSNNLYFKLAMLTFILTAQFYAERHSINDFINGNRILRTIDLWGREEHGYDKNKERDSKKGY